MGWGVDVVVEVVNHGGELSVVEVGHEWKMIGVCELVFKGMMRVVFFSLGVCLLGVFVVEEIYVLSVN